MQITDLAKEQQILPLFRLAFRPFFIAGAIFSIIAISIWALQLIGLIHVSVYGNALFWHIHEMVFGFVCAIIIGFLLTAVQTWTGQRGVHGSRLMALLLLWLLGRLAMLFPQVLGNTASAFIDLAFIPAAAVFLAIAIVKVKQSRNLFFIPLLLMFTVANAYMHLSVMANPIIDLISASHLAVMLITLLMSIMAGRVTPMFTANGTHSQKVNNIVLLDRVTNGSLMILVLCFVMQPLLEISPALFSFLFGLAGVSQMLRWLRWKPWITLGIPLLWSLHTAILFIWMGLLSLSLSYLMSYSGSNHLWHLLTIGGMGGLILAMISRVSLGHTGQALTPPKLMTFAFLLIFASAILRGLGPVLMPIHYTNIINLSVLCWILSFGIFVIKYGPMLLMPRKDGRPG